MDDDTGLTPPPLKTPLHNSSSPRDQEPDGNLAKLQQWYEERMARKLRGEYETAVFHLSELVSLQNVQYVLCC